MSYYADLSYQELIREVSREKALDIFFKSYYYSNIVNDIYTYVMNSDTPFDSTDLICFTDISDNKMKLQWLRDTINDDVCLLEILELLGYVHDIKSEILEYYGWRY